MVYNKPIEVQNVLPIKANSDSPDSTTELPFEYLELLSIMICFSVCFMQIYSRAMPKDGTAQLFL